MQPVARALAGLGGVLLLINSYLHSTGLAGVREVVGAVELPGFFAAALPVLWLFFSWHLVILAAPLLVASAANPRWFVPAAGFCGAVALGDFFWIFGVAGWFPGTVIQLVVVALLAASAGLHLRANRASRPA